MEVYIVGICIAVCGNFLISISLNIQKYTHVRQSQRGMKPYYTSRLWWCGILLMGLGELGNFAAYGFAPASLIAPLGCVSVIVSAVISVVFLKETLRASDILGGALALTGTYFLVTFAPHSSPHVTANMVERSLVSWTFLIYFCRNMKHIVIMMILVALLASVTVISVKAVSGMITETIRGSHLQLTYPIFYIMFIIMVTSCAFQIKFLNQAMKMFDATEIVPINYVFFTASAIVAGILFYEEFYGLSLIYIIMFVIGCLLAFTGVFLLARARPRIKMDRVFISMSQIPGKSCTDKVQPQSDDSKYGKLAPKLTCNSGIQQDEP
ncbi:NIPA-like protein 2 isoform X2 [Carassius gibelio]|uniref:NIPA-like protein 2 isoform X2 n=1 Tax=Carassius gibelio TaxID=101364 RepID=UPI00227797F3|nr:NIPA-like protein 2 isoform X2 [Carassius gibelio]